MYGHLRLASLLNNQGVMAWARVLFGLLPLRPAYCCREPVRHGFFFSWTGNRDSESLRHGRLIFKFMVTVTVLVVLITLQVGPLGRWGSSAPTVPASSAGSAGPGQPPGARRGY